MSSESQSQPQHIETIHPAPENVEAEIIPVIITETYTIPQELQNYHQQQQMEQQAMDKSHQQQKQQMEDAIKSFQQQQQQPPPLRSSTNYTAGALSNSVVPHNNLMSTINLRQSNNWANITREPTNPYMSISESLGMPKPEPVNTLEQELTTTDISAYSLYSISSNEYSYSSGTFSSGSSGASSYVDDSSTSGSSNYLSYTTTHPSIEAKPRQHNIPEVEVFEPETECQSKYYEHTWNEIFQYLMDQPDTSEYKYELMAKTATDFVYCANTFGKIIISERNLPDEQKTIKPLELGGVAGGQKYLCKDIIFKFVMDVEIAPGLWMYGDQSRSDEKAQKSAGHELKGLNHFMEHSEGIIRFPLAAIIDYGGYRLLAISRLPINKKTIVYGSNDGGKTVHNSDTKVDTEMRRLAKKMNIKGHLVGLTSPTLIYGPGDIEVHKGTDGRYYMIDFARAFPPEYPQIVGNRIGREIFYYMLRPEFVMKTETSLSPDAFSGWQTGKDEELSNWEVIEASAKLHNETIPDCVKHLQSALDDESDLESERLLIRNLLKFNMGGLESEQTRSAVSLARIINIIHSRGINLRYIGLICQKTTSRPLKQMLMTEMVARVWKKIIKAKMRQSMQKSNRPTEEPARIISEVFDILMNKHKRAQHLTFWSTMNPGGFKNAALQAFTGCLSKTEMKEDFDLRITIDLKLLVMRLVSIMRVRINPDAYREFIANPNYVITKNDIEDVESSVKYPTVVDYAAGVQLIEDIKKVSNYNSHQAPQSLRWVDTAQMKMQSALRSMPLSAKIISKQAFTYLFKANMSPNVQDSIALLSTSINLLRQASSYHKDNADLCAMWGITHLKMATNNLFFTRNVDNFKRHADLALEKLDTALAIDPDVVASHLKQTILMLPQEHQHRNSVVMLYELYTLIYLQERSKPESLIRSLIPKAINHITLIRCYETPEELSSVLDDTIMPKLFDSLPNLTNVMLRGISITPALLQSLSKLEKIEMLRLDKVTISTESNEDAPEGTTHSLNQLLINVFNSSPSLSKLQLKSTNLEGHSIEVLAPLMRGLKNLHLQHVNLTDGCLTEIAPYLVRPRVTLHPLLRSHW
ncbi:hypothetical protein SAMD00019534_017500 [Acytostelium subglobosum LB1]|uniref:hypothetical protein n=1 Tax=Acytostelium subglobosum LB1 TaxID=1410327 RepID=UPI0006450E29|nr:hypothetical protein SAMD00019534_017500 [Acytostelium subglobosum LB1]GAM18575.1 hypothetical protein SAMD00019534_017500 [Acytostelium subglobosum LB1]|eukprot:XP_012757795.1 hypothetical protein SAMD00019534_017500 [Acytostelium subglobosum LB1]